MSTFRVHCATTPLFASGEARWLENAIVNSFRDEVNGLGAASVSIKYLDYSSDISAASPVVSAGSWIAIQEYIEGTSPVAPAVYDPSMLWWGYVANKSVDCKRKFGDNLVELSAYQFGHFLRQNTIDYKDATWKNGVAFDEGFNPNMDGVIVGNKVPSAIEINRNDTVATDPICAAGHFWTPKSAIQYIAKFCNPVITVEASFANINETKHNFLNKPESMNSFQGSSLLDAIDDIMQPLKICFKITSLSYIDMVFIDTTDTPTGTPYEWELNRSTAKISYTDSQEKYDRVVLRGDRVLFCASTTTYGPSSDPSIMYPKWTDAMATAYVTPIPSKATNIKDFDTSIIDKDNTTATDINEQESPEDTEADKKKLIADQDAIRKKDTLTYQQFGFSYGDDEGTINGTSTENVVMWTRAKPGMVNDNYGNDKILLFPRLTLQNVGGATIDESFKSAPVVEESIHATPPATELKFETFLPISNWTDPSSAYTAIANKNKEAMFFYRSLGGQKAYSGSQQMFRPVWINGTVGEYGFQTWEYNLNWSGVTIKAPYPEALGCGFDSLFRDVTSPDTLSAVEDYGKKRDDWYSDSIGASLFDPQRVAYPFKGHWSRLVFSFAAYSDQKIEIAYPLNTIGFQRVKVVEDDSFKIWIHRKGFVHNTKKDNTFSSSVGYPDILNWVDYTENNFVVRNDLPNMNDRLKALHEYWTKEKRSFRVEDRVWDEEGTLNTIPVTVGQFVSTVKDTSSVTCNSYVASVEYLLNEQTPRVIVATEYPSSPVKTRTRQLAWGNAHNMVNAGKPQGAVK